MKRPEAIIIGAAAVLWIMLSFFFYHDVRPTGMTTFYTVKGSGTDMPLPILPKEPFRFEFTAKENNLGIVEIRLRSLKRIDDYAAVFRIRPKGQSAWYSERIYYMIPLGQNELYPFGFPPIALSKGIAYEIELLAIGNKDTPVAVSTLYPPVVARYQFPLAKIRADGLSGVIHFIINKLVNTAANIHFILNILFFLCPVGFFLGYIIKRNYFDAVIFGLAVNIISFTSLGYIHLVSDIRYMYVIALFLILVIWRRLSASFLFLVCAVLFGFSAVAVAVGQIAIAERNIVWVYILTIISVLALLFGAKTDMEPTSGTKQWWDSMMRIIILSMVGIISLLASYRIILYTKHFIFPRHSGKSSITSIGPTVLYNGSFVVISGNGFGDTYDHSVRLMSDYGEIEESEWTDTAITFRVPSEWKPGSVSLWLDCPNTPCDKQSHGKYTVEIVDKNTPWSAKDDLHYQEIRLSQPAVREANGYIKRWF